MMKLSTDAMKSLPVFLTILLGVTLPSCSGQSERGVADKRSDYKAFIPLKGDISRDGLKAVKPFFKRADRAAILHAIERACQGDKGGSSSFNPRTQAGYYVNCNPKNRQLLNGYVPLDPSKEPHSKH